MGETAPVLSPQLKQLDLNLLVALSVLLSTRSVTGAAVELGLSQPAMSRTLGRLRAALGDPLFVRAGARLQPTPRALALEARLTEVLRGVDEVVAATAAFQPATATRRFAVATSDYGEAVLLPPLLRRLEREAPGLSLRVVAVPTDWEARLESGELDLLWAPRSRASRAVVWSRLFDETFAFVVRRGHPVLRRPVTLERYLALRHVAIAPAGRDETNPLDTALARLGLRRTVVASVPSFLVVPALVQHSDLGVTLPARIVEGVARRHALASRPLPFVMPGFGFFQAWHERVRRDPGHAWLRQAVLALGRER